MNSIEHHLSRLSMSVTCAAPVRCVGVRLVILIGPQCPPCRAPGKAHLLLDCDPKVLQEMKPIRDLARLRCALTSSLRIETAPVSVDDLDRRVPLQPLSRTCYASVLQNVEDFTALQIDDHRAVAP